MKINEINHIRTYSRRARSRPTVIHSQVPLNGLSGSTVTTVFVSVLCVLSILLLKWRRI